MDKEVMKPVAWVRFCSDGCYEGPIMNSDSRMDGVRRTSGAWTPLFTAQPVPRDVLMAVLNEANTKYMEICGAQFGDEYISAIADRYASKVQPEPVNQQLLAALKRLLHKAYKQNWQDNYPSEVECAEAAIAAAMQSTWPEDTSDYGSRIAVIGQNGNDGLSYKEQK